VPGDRLDAVLSTAAAEGRGLVVDRLVDGLYEASDLVATLRSDVLRRISIACRSSRFSRSRAFSLAAAPPSGPARLPASISVHLIHAPSVCAVQPIFPAANMMVVHHSTIGDALRA
jgi:hypothetical protein